ncbi:hypothetical protein AAMO2058_001019000 [Amorphochlora amoebiformis]
MGKLPWDPLFALIPVYMMAVPMMRIWYPIKGRDEKKTVVSDTLKAAMLTYNVIMSIFSFVCSTGMIYTIMVRHNGVIKGPSCTEYAEDPVFDWITHLFYWSKYVEFADTIFMILKNKPVSWLHFYHHCGAAITMGLLARVGNEGTWIFVSLNGGIHTFMYAYYGLALVGIRFKAKWLITMMQIVQFLVGFYLFYTYRFVQCFYDSFPLMLTYYWTYSYVGVLLCFFTNFFITSYLSPVKRPRKKVTHPSSQEIKRKSDSRAAA